MKLVAIIAASAGALIVGVIGGRQAGFVYNRSDSMPPGLWQVHDGPVERGAVVLICPADSKVFRGAREAHYLLSGFCSGGFAPLLKPVAAVAGDQVRVTPTGATVNGRPIANTALIRADGAGRLLPRNQIGLHTVSQGEIWLFSSYNRYSFDSRYFGPLRVASVQGVARPVLVDRR